MGVKPDAVMVGGKVAHAQSFGSELDATPGHKGGTMDAEKTT